MLKPTGKPDMSMKETTAPAEGRCRSGHGSDGMLYQGKPVRWFRVSSRHDKAVNGVYCEPCLVVANFIKSPKNQEPADG